MNTTFNKDIIDAVISLYLYISKKIPSILELSNILFGLDIFYISKYKKPIIGGEYGLIDNHKINIDVFRYLLDLKNLKGIYFYFIDDCIGSRQYLELDDLKRQEINDITKFFLSYLSLPNGKYFTEDIPVVLLGKLLKTEFSYCNLFIDRYYTYTESAKQSYCSFDSYRVEYINIKDIFFSIFHNKEIVDEIFKDKEVNFKLSNLKINTCTITIDINEIPYNFSYESLNITKNSTVCIVNNSLKVDMQNYTPSSLLEIFTEKEVNLEQFYF